MLMDHCERAYSSVVKIRCADIKEGSFPHSFFFTGRNLHFTGLQNQSVEVRLLSVEVPTLASM